MPLPVPSVPSVPVDAPLSVAPLSVASPPVQVSPLVDALVDVLSVVLLSLPPLGSVIVVQLMVSGLVSALSEVSEAELQVPNVGSWVVPQVAEAKVVPELVSVSSPVVPEPSLAVVPPLESPTVVPSLVSAAVSVSPPVMGTQSTSSPPSMDLQVWICPKREEIGESTVQPVSRAAAATRVVRVMRHVDMTAPFNMPAPRNRSAGARNIRCSRSVWARGRGLPL